MPSLVSKSNRKLTVDELNEVGTETVIVWNTPPVPPSEPACHRTALLAPTIENLKTSKVSRYQFSTLRKTLNTTVVTPVAGITNDGELTAPLLELLPVR